MPAIRPRLPMAARPDVDFDAALRGAGLGVLRRAATASLQINVGKRCNQACHHCHVEAGPARTEVMSRAIAERALALVAATPSITTVDITGGAPELCPSFRWMVEEARRLGRRVIDRCNLTILFEPGQEDLADFLAGHEVEVIASLPCYTADNVDQQRGHGVFDRSIEGIRLLNARGYGRDGVHALHLVYNPGGGFLPPAQAALEARYKRELADRFGIGFDRLYTITNLPIARFADFLEARGEAQAYMNLLVNHFNPAAVPALMCRSLVSVGWDGRLYDCDFNQMLELDLGGAARTIGDLASLEGLEGAAIATASHCFGCTAGAGSSCGGSLA